MASSRQFNFETLAEFDDHRMVSFIYDSARRLRGFIALHRSGRRRESFGATRLWRYGAPIDALKDALRLSRLMSYKSAMAGLPYGGAKGVLMDTSGTPRERTRLIEEYARRVNGLGGSFITGTDAGMSMRDVLVMRRVTPYVVGVRANPTRFTAFGLFSSLKVCLKEIGAQGSCAGQHIAVQGLGKIGFELVGLLYASGARITACDIDVHRVRAAGRRFPKISFVAPEKIYEQKCDVFSPCALGGVLTRRTVKKLKTAAIVGGANNQLGDEDAGDALWRAGILYAPDYVVNAGGLISVVDEFQHPRIDEAKIERRVARIAETLRAVLDESRRTKTAPHRVADAMAETRMESWNEQ